MCPNCQSVNNEVLETRATDKGRVDRRRHQCRGCRARWTSRAVVEPESISTTGSVVTGRPNTTGSAAITKPPPTGSVNPPTGSVGGIRGGVSPVQGSISSLLSNPDQSQTRAGPKKQAKTPGDFTRCRDAFVAAWEVAYEEKYPFEPKDATTLAAMLKSHPEYAEASIWGEMVFRYLGNDFYGQKRHPLVFLATKAREFAGTPRNGVPQKIADSRETTRSWARREVG